MPILLHLVFPAVLTIVQISFMSHLPAPVSSISFPLLVIALAIFVNRPVKGALWALLGGIVLDLHGIYPFGTEIFVLLSTFYLTRLLFMRFITNASSAALFLLSTIVVALHAIMLYGLDALRVIFNAEPFIVGQNATPVSAAAGTVLVNGLLAIAVLASWKRIRTRLGKRFIVRK